MKSNFDNIQYTKLLGSEASQEYILQQIEQWNKDNINDEVHFIVEDFETYCTELFTKIRQKSKYVNRTTLRK